MKVVQALLVFSGVFLPWSQVKGDEAIVDFVGTTFTGSMGDQTVGWRFHLSTPVLLTSLGVYDHIQDGFNEPHEVGLWTSSGNLLADGLLATGLSGTLMDDFRYVDVPRMVLPVGDYVVGAHFIGQFVDPFSDDNLSLTTHSSVEYQGRNGSPGPGFQFPANFLGSNGFNFVTSNIQFLVEFSDADAESSAFVIGDRPGNGGIPAPPETITLESLDLLDGSSFTLDPHETLVLTSGPLYIAPGAVFSGNGIIQGSIINAGLLRIPIVRIQTVSQAVGGVVEIQLPEPATPGGSISILGDGLGVGGGTLLSFKPMEEPTPMEPPIPIVIEGTPDANEGTIRFDASLAVTGSFEQRESGALRMFIGGNDMPGVNYSQLTVGEGVTLAGAIELVLQPELFGEFDYGPMVGDTFDLIVSAQGINISDSGLTLRSFATETGPPLNGDLTFTPYDSGIAADPDDLFQIGETIFRLDLVENDTILRATLIHPISLIPEPSCIMLVLMFCGGILLLPRREF